jgi:hypothetical protein
MRMLRVGGEKYMVRLSPQADEIRRVEQLFDLTDDPTEQRDLATTRTDRLGELRRAFQDLIARQSLAREDRVAGVSEEDGPLSPQEAALEQQLKALGYVE